MELSKQLLDELFEYRDGALFWKTRNAKTKYLIGTRAGYVYTFISGYKTRFIWIQGVAFREHRLIYLMHHGNLPDAVDHIDGDSLNNCIENLREVDVIQNQQNAKIRKDNKSGIKGVHWNKCLSKWKAQIKINGKNKHIGIYDDLNVAAEAIKAAREKYHGEYARHE